MKNVMKAAHKLTKEIKAEFPEVDYSAQLGICISYLAKEGEKTMVELKGSEKQIIWAEKIREILIESVNEKSVPNIYHIFTKTEKGQEFIEELKKSKIDNPNFFTNENMSNQFVIAKIRGLIEEETDSNIFIENQTTLSFLKTVLK